MRLTKNESRFIVHWKMDPEAQCECSAKLESLTLESARKEAKELLGSDEKWDGKQKYSDRKEYFKKYFEKNKLKRKIREATSSR